MTFELVIDPRAEADLTEIYDFIAERSGWQRAATYIASIERLCFGLTNFPERGRSRDDLKPGLRAIAHRRRVLIAYAIDGRRVVILRVFNAGRNVTPEALS